MRRPEFHLPNSSEYFANPKCYWGATLAPRAALQREFFRSTILRLDQDWFSRNTGWAFQLSVSPLNQHANLFDQLALDAFEAYHTLAPERAHLLDAKLKALLAHEGEREFETVRFEFATFGLLGHSEIPWDVEPLAGDDLSKLLPSPDAVIHMPGMPPTYLECTTIGCALYEERDRVDKTLQDMVGRACEKIGVFGRKMALDIEHRGRTQTNAINVPEVRAAARAIAKTTSGEVTLRLDDCWIRLTWRDLILDRTQSTPSLNVWLDKAIVAKMAKSEVGPRTFLCICTRIIAPHHRERMTEEVRLALAKTLHRKRRQLQKAGVVSSSVLWIRPRAAWMELPVLDAALQIAMADGEFGELPAVGFVEHPAQETVPMWRLRWVLRTNRTENHATQVMRALLDHSSKKPVHHSGAPADIGSGNEFRIVDQQASGQPGGASR